MSKLITYELLKSKGACASGLLEVIEKYQRIDFAIEYKQAMLDFPHHWKWIADNLAEYKYQIISKFKLGDIAYINFGHYKHWRKGVVKGIEGTYHRPLSLNILTIFTENGERYDVLEDSNVFQSFEAMKYKWMTDASSAQEQK